MTKPRLETYREAEGGLEVLVGDMLVGSIPQGHPREEEARRLAAAGKIVIAPASPAAEPADPPAPEPTVRQLIAALIRRGVISKGDIDAEQR